MAALNLKTDDAVVRSVLATLEGHIDTMMRAATQVQDVNGEIQQHFQAACSAKYQEKIADWQNRYQQLKNAYQSFHGSFAMRPHAGQHRPRRGPGGRMEAGAAPPTKS